MGKRMFNSINKLYKGVVIKGDDLGIKLMHQGINFYWERYEFFYKNTCLCICRQFNWDKKFSINCKAEGGKEEKRRIKGYKDALIAAGFKEEDNEDNEDDFISLDNYKEPTPLDYLRSLTGFKDYDKVIDSGKINDNYVYVVYRPKNEDFDLYYLYVLKVGNCLGTALICNRTITFQSLEELQIELAVYKSFLADVADKKVVEKVTVDNLYNYYKYEIYKIHPDYNDGYVYLIYEDVDYKEILVKNIVNEFNDVMTDLSFYKKLFTYGDQQDTEDKDILECVLLEEEVVIGDIAVGKTKDKGKILNGDVVYEVIELNKDNGYLLILWGFSNYLTSNHCTKYHLKSLKEVSKKLVEFEKGLEEEQLEEEQESEQEQGSGFSMGGMCGMWGLGRNPLYDFDMDDMDGIGDSLYDFDI